MLHVQAEDRQLSDHRQRFDGTRKFYLASSLRLRQGAPFGALSTRFVPTGSTTVNTAGLGRIDSCWSLLSPCPKVGMMIRAIHSCNRMSPFH